MQELDVQTIFGVLLRKCKLIILFTIIGALLFGAYTRFFVAETYKSEFEMYVISYRDQNSTTAQGMSSSQLMAAQDLVNEYIVVMDNDRVLQSVANSLQKRGYTMTTKALRSVAQAFGRQQHRHAAGIRRDHRPRAFAGDLSGRLRGGAGAVCRYHEAEQRGGNGAAAEGREERSQPCAQHRAWCHYRPGAVRCDHHCAVYAG